MPVRLLPPHTFYLLRWWCLILVVLSLAAVPHADRNSGSGDPVAVGEEALLRSAAAEQHARIAIGAGVPSAAGMAADDSTLEREEFLPAASREASLPAMSRHASPARPGKAATHLPEPPDPPPRSV